MAQKYVTLDSNDIATAFYDSATQTPPEGAIEISDSQYAYWQPSPANKQWINGAVVDVTPPSLAQQATSLLSVGCQIASTATPSLNGTYPTTPDSQSHVQAEITSILLNNAFADGAPTIEWQDTSGDNHTFSIAQYKSLATALAAFVSGCLKVINGQSTALPTQPATIP